MQDFWDIRYQEEGVYGFKPNPFWVNQLSNISGTHCLLPCEGEGRNAIWAAQQGWMVDAFDGSQVATKTCKKWATKAQVEVNCFRKDAFDFQPSLEYDAIGLFYSHMPPSLRAEFHRRAVSWLKPGGTIVLEAFHNQQLGLTSGGPQALDMLFTCEILKDDFNELELQSCEALVMELDEGPYHQGTAHIVQFVGIKALEAIQK